MENTVTVPLQEFDEMREEILRLRSIIESGSFEVLIENYSGLIKSLYPNVRGNYDYKLGQTTYSRYLHYPKNIKLEEIYKNDIKVHNDLQEKTRELDKAKIEIEELKRKLEDNKKHIESLQNTKSKKGFWS